MMQNQISLQQVEQEHLHFGHLGLVMLAAFALLGISYFKNPGLFNFSNSQSSLLVADVPHYYAYVPPAESDQPQVAGASTVASGPSIINEDGSVTPVDTGSVLGASTENVQLSLDDIKVKEIPDSPDAIKKYFSDTQSIEGSFINNVDFQSALSSGNQQQVDAQAVKLQQIQDSLNALSVPTSLVKLQKLKITQYQAGVGLLKNFTKADDNPELVGQYLDQFLKSQQDMDTENLAAQQKYNIDLGYSQPQAQTADGSANSDAATTLSQMTGVDPNTGDILPANVTQNDNAQ